MICLFVSQTQVYMTPMWSTRHQWTRSLRTHSLSLSRRLCPLSSRISADIGSLSTGGMTYQGKVSVLCALIVILDINNQYIYIYIFVVVFFFLLYHNRSSGVGGEMHESEQEAHGHSHTRSGIRLHDGRAMACLTPNLSDGRVWLAGENWDRDCLGVCSLA